jgi:hypothetical protein
MNSERRKDRGSKGSPEPHRARLPGFITDKDVGLGDVIKRATSIVGIRPCSSCSERAAHLSNWLVFSRRH